MTNSKGNEVEIEKYPGDSSDGVDSPPEEAKQDLRKNIENYKRLIFKMARKYVRNRVEHEDLVQEAMFGLLLACRDFDPSRSRDFHTYAIYRMKGKMYEYCIGNENPIYVPTHVAKAASYVKQMQRLLDKEPQLSTEATLITEIISAREHKVEEELNDSSRYALSELKRKLGNIAHNSKMKYEALTRLAMESLSLVVSDDILSKHPKETDLIDEIVSNKQLSQQLRESLGERRFTVISLRALGWNLREIAEHLAELGYTNREGKQMSRQAVKGILSETLQAVKRVRILQNPV